MSIVAFHVQIVVPHCPCRATCCDRRPLHGLAEQLRSEMRYGRDHRRRPTILPGVTVGMAVAFGDCPERN